MAICPFCIATCNAISDKNKSGAVICSIYDFSIIKANPDALAKITEKVTKEHYKSQDNYKIQTGPLQTQIHNNYLAKKDFHKKATYFIIKMWPNEDEDFASPPRLKFKIQGDFQERGMRGLSISQLSAYYSMWCGTDTILNLKPTFAG